jgi:hypothetical protein
MDVDRGYYPRRAFIDRQFNPNIAAHVFTQLNSLFSNAKIVSIDTDRSIKGSQLIFTADSQENHIHFGDANAISVAHRQLQKNSEAIDLTASGREQIFPAADNDTEQKNNQTNPQINAVLIRLN